MSQCELMPMPAPSVMLHNGRPATTSLEVAKFFGKRHDHVVRGIKELIDNCVESFSAPNFGEANQLNSFSGLNFELASYIDEQGKTRPMYIIYRDGFMLLVMGYTGKKALVIKLAYIEAFNALEAELQRQREGALPPADALAPSQQAQLKALVDGSACCRRSTSARATAKCGAASPATSRSPSTRNCRRKG